MVPQHITLLCIHCLSLPLASSYTLSVVHSPFLHLSSTIAILTPFANETPKLSSKDPGFQVNTALFYSPLSANLSTLFNTQELLLYKLYTLCDLVVSQTISASPPRMLPDLSTHLLESTNNSTPLHLFIARTTSTPNEFRKSFIPPTQHTLI